MADNKSSFISSDSNELNHNQSINDELVGHVKPELISQVTNIILQSLLPLQIKFYPKLNRHLFDYIIDGT